MKDFGPVKSYQTIHREKREAEALVAAYAEDRVLLFDMIMDLSAPLEAMLANKNIAHHSPEVQHEVRETIDNLHALLDYMRKRNEGDMDAQPPILGARRFPPEISPDT